jgi:hypothetical protein
MASIPETLAFLKDSANKTHEKLDEITVLCRQLYKEHVEREQNAVQRVGVAVQPHTPASTQRNHSLRVVPPSQTITNIPFERAPHVAESGILRTPTTSRKRGRAHSEAPGPQEGSRIGAPRAFHYFQGTIVLELDSTGGLPKYCVLVGWSVWMYGQAIPAKSSNVCGPLFHFRVPSVKNPRGLTAINRERILKELPQDVLELQLSFPGSESWIRMTEEEVLAELLRNSRHKPRTPPTMKKKQETIDSDEVQEEAKPNTTGRQEPIGGANPACPIEI